MITRHNFYTFVALLGCVLLTACTQCDKDYPEPPDAFYREKLQVSPYQKIYAIGDTIWITFETPDKTLYDNYTGTRVLNDSAYLEVGLYFNKHYPEDTVRVLNGTVIMDSVYDLSFVSPYPSQSYLTFNTDCQDKRFYFKVGYVPDQRGVYSISPFSRVLPCPGKNALPYSEFRFYFDVPDAHKSVIYSISYQLRTHEIGLLETNLEAKNNYGFEVK